MRRLIPLALSLLVLSLTGCGAGGLISALTGSSYTGTLTSTGGQTATLSNIVIDPLQNLTAEIGTNDFGANPVTTLLSGSLSNPSSVSLVLAYPTGSLSLTGTYVTSGNTLTATLNGPLTIGGNAETVTITLVNTTSNSLVVTRHS